MTPDNLDYEPPRILALDRPMTMRHPLPQRSPSAISSLGDRDPEALIAGYGSPLVIYDGDVLARTYRSFLADFREFWPRTSVSYSVKTNYLSALLALLHREGAQLEVVSGFEYEICRRLGIPGREIVFNGPWKSSDELRLAFENGSQVNIDNLDELLRVESLADEIPGMKRVGLRFNMDVSYPPWDKFGFNMDSADAMRMVRRLSARDDIDFVGLHMHVGTYIPNPDQYEKGAAAMIEFALRIRDEVGRAPAVIDMGGGYASNNTLRGQLLPGTSTSPTTRMYAESMTRPLLAARTKEGYEPELVLEPGRAIVDECGDILTTVVAVKPLRSGGRAAVIDAGVGILPTAYWYDHEIVPLGTPDRPPENVKLFGPLCMQIDVVRPSVVLPSPRPGDIYLIRRVGAYNFSQSMQFIYSRPNYLLKRGDRLEVIRRLEGVPEATALEQLPPDLEIGSRSSS